MARRKGKPMSEGKKNIIGMLLESKMDYAAQKLGQGALVA